MAFFKLFQNAHADAVIVFSESEHSDSCDANFRKLAGFELDGGILVLKKSKEKCLLVSKMNYQLAKILARKNGVRVIPFSRDTIEKVARKVLRGSKTVGIDYSSVSLARKDRLRKWTCAKLVDVSKWLEQSRVVKTSEEVGKIKKAVKLTMQALGEVESELKLGMTELEAQKVFSSFALEHDCKLAFPPIFLSDARARFPHASATNKKIDKLLLCDVGLEFDGYKADISQCFFPTRDKFLLREYEKLEGVFDSCCDFISENPNCKCARLYGEFERLMKKSHLKIPPHSLGHGLGLEVHEAPSLSKLSKEKLEFGTVVAIEPATYTSKYGLRFERDVLVGKNKVSIL